MLLEFREGLRVVIHTANLIHKDWDQKTQGYDVVLHVRQDIRAKSKSGAVVKHQRMFVVLKTTSNTKWLFKSGAVPLYRSLVTSLHVCLLTYHAIVEILVLLLTNYYLKIS